MKIFGKILAAFMCIAFSWVSATQAANYTFKFIDDVPGAQDTVPFAINNTGLVVGSYGVAAPNSGIGHGFVYNAGTSTPFDIPGASLTMAYGLNDVGQIVGEYRTDVYHGFLKTGSEYTFLNVPGAQSSSNARGINKAGKIVGFYDYDGPSNHSFSYFAGDYFPFAVSGATLTQAWGINDSGQIVGYYFDSSYHGFLFDGQNFAPPINFPGAESTQAYKINNHGDIVGGYVMNGVDHGFILKNGKYVTLDVPGAVETLLTGINDLGQVVGGFIDGNGHYHGFIATPKGGLSAIQLLLLE
jgi:probable HAF family extracellular repeat protein